MASKWMISGTYFEACNCDVVCPFRFTSKPTTPDDCRVFDAWQMERMETGTLPDMPEIMSGMWMAMAALWIAGLAALVLAEKLLPAGERIAKLTCLPLIGAGIWLLVGS